MTFHRRSRARHARTIQFRAPLLDEAEILTALAHASKRVWNYPKEWMALWQPSLTVTAEQMTRWHFEVGESDDCVVGFFAVSFRAGVAELEHFWVSPSLGGRGYGRRLLERALLYCRRIGAARLRVVADPNAEGFYRRLGGVVAGRAPSVPVPRTLPVLVFELSGTDPAGAGGRRPLPGD